MTGGIGRLAAVMADVYAIACHGIGAIGINTPPGCACVQSSILDFDLRFLAQLLHFVFQCPLAPGLQQLLFDDIVHLGQ